MTFVCPSRLGIDQIGKIEQPCKLLLASKLSYERRNRFTSVAFECFCNNDRCPAAARSHPHMHLICVQELKTKELPAGSESRPFSETIENIIQTPLLPGEALGTLSDFAVASETEEPMSRGTPENQEESLPRTATAQGATTSQVGMGHGLLLGISICLIHL